MRILARIAIILALTPAAAFAQNRGALYAPNNLSDLPNPATARSNLGLGSLAVLSTIAGLDASASDLTDPNGSNVATVASRAGEVLDVIGGFGAVPNAAGNNVDGTISAGSATFTSVTANFPSSARGDDIWIDGVGANGFPLDTTIAAVNSGTSITLAAAASLPSGGYYIESAIEATPGTGCVPGGVETLSASAAEAGQLTVTSCGVFTIPTVAAAGSGGTDNAGVPNSGVPPCVVVGTTGTVPMGFGYFEAVVETNSGGGIAAVLSMLRNGTYTMNPTTLSAEPVASETCGALTGATLNLSAAMGVETVNATVRGSYTGAPSGAQAVTSSGGISGDTYMLATAKAGSYTYGVDSSGALASAIAKANSTFATSGQPQAIKLPAGSYIIDHTALPALTNGVTIEGAGWFRSRLFLGPSYSGGLFTVQTVASGFSQATGNAWSASTVSPGQVFRNFGILGDLDSGNAVTAFDVQGENTNFALIENVFVRPLVGPCLYVGDQQIGAGGNAYAREGRIQNLQCFNAGTPLQPAELFQSQGTGSGIDSTNEWVISTRVFGSMGPGVVVGSLNTHKPTTYLQFTSLSSEDAGLANPVADAIDIGTPSDTGGVAVIHIENLDVPFMASMMGCGLRLGGGHGSSQSYQIQVADGDIGAVPNGICYGNVRDTEVRLDGIGGSTQTVIFGPNAGAANYLTAPSANTGNIVSYARDPNNLLLSEPGVLANLGTARLPGFTYGPDYAGTLTSEAIGAIGKMYAERFDVGATSVLKSVSFDVTAANPSAWQAEVCVYRDVAGTASNLVLDTGAISVAANATGVQTDMLASPMVLPGPGSYVVGLMASATGESL